MRTQARCHAGVIRRYLLRLACGFVSRKPDLVSSRAARRRPPRRPDGVAEAGVQPAVTPVAGRLVEQQREPSAQVPQCHPHRAPRWRDKAEWSAPFQTRMASSFSWERSSSSGTTNGRARSGPGYMRLETIAPVIYDSVVGLPAVAS